MAIYTRMQQKHDIEANWIKAKNFIPLEGEIIIYDADENYSYQRIKIGDGTTRVNYLPFDNIQGDWNQNDETFPDYIKNRTHYETVSEFQKVSAGNLWYDGFIENALRVENDGGYDNDTLNLLVNLDGKLFRIYAPTIYEGYKEGILKVTPNPDYEDCWYVAFGNEHLFDKSRPDTGEDFLFRLAGDRSIYTISLYVTDYPLWTDEMKEEPVHYTLEYGDLIVKPLDEKYIPDTIARTEVVNNTISNASEQITGLISDIQGLINTYILNIDYSTLAFDTTEIVIGNTTTSTSVLGQAILGQLILA